MTARVEIVAAAALVLSACCNDTGCPTGNVLFVADAPTERASVVVLLNGAELGAFVYSDTEQCSRPAGVPGAQLCAYWTSPGRLQGTVELGEAPGDVRPMDGDVLRVRFEQDGATLTEHESRLDYDEDACVGRTRCPPFAFVEL